ncbi:MAG TPA: hypothetical protein DDZ89_00795, partial [Clostridiales bacterium]|nr:hypothetical protein [Clostridiales bacterium]
FKIIPRYDIFDYEEILLTMRSLFAKSPEEYHQFDALLKKYLFQTANHNVKTYMKAHSKEIHSVTEKLKEEKYSNIEIRTRIPTEEKNLAQQAQENKEIISNILQRANTPKLLPILLLQEQEMVSLVQTYTDKKIDKMLNKAMLYNLLHDNDPLFNQLCIMGSNRFRKTKQKVKKELNVKQAEIDQIEKLLSYERNHFFKSASKRTVYDKMDRPIIGLRQDEYVLLSKFIRQNAAKFRTKVSRTMVCAKRKTFEFKKTIKKSLETFGEPVKLYYKRPQIKKTRLVCITDVSESVKLHVKLILQLIYELSSVFKSGVRSFMFVGNLYEVTDTLNEFPIVEAIDLACEQAPMEYSNYNEAFGLFVKNHIGIIDKNTIVIIFGDARNNRYDDGVQYLKQIKKKAKTIVWLNPEVKSKWNTGDSIMGKYKPMVNAVYQVNTFNELVGFIDQFAV